MLRSKGEHTVDVLWPVLLTSSPLQTTKMLKLFLLLLDTNQHKTSNAFNRPASMKLT